MFCLSDVRSMFKLNSDLFLNVLIVFGCFDGCFWNILIFVNVCFFSILFLQTL
ncbi:unnamed protein product [Meloidogyne enterolobii]|uniref:Uncharacterized protein n=1 Tax=Meloidogyne enterolobii TaxID=390850 RepID=A0ACB0Y302_MELEN